MAAIARIDPHVDVSAFAHILNLFNSLGPSAGMTDWDTVCLHAMHQADPDRRLGQSAHAGNRAGDLRRREREEEVE